MVITLTECLSDIQKQWRLVHDAYQRGYTTGLRDGLAQGPAHPAVQQSVQRMFGDWDGAQAAQQRSVERFKQQRNGGDRRA